MGREKIVVGSLGERSTLGLSVPAVGAPKGRAFSPVVAAERLSYWNSAVLVCVAIFPSPPSRSPFGGMAAEGSSLNETGPQGTWEWGTQC